LVPNWPAQATRIGGAAKQPADRFDEESSMISTKGRGAAVVLGTAILALGLGACGSSSAGTQPTATQSGSSSGGSLPKVLVFSPLSLAPPALRSLSEGIKGYAGSQGWEVIVQDPNFDPAKQAQGLNEVISSGRAGAGWFIPVAVAGAKDVLTNAQQKKVPMLISASPKEAGFDGPQPGIAFDYIDYAAAGDALGSNMGSCVNSKLSGSAKVLLLKSPPSQAGLADIVNTAKASLARTAAGATIVQELEVSDRAKAQTDVSNALQGNPDIDAVIATNDEGALGALGAFATAGKQLPCLTEFGGNDEVLGLVKAGKIYASVALQFEADLKQAFDALVAMQADPTLAGPVLTVPQQVVKAPGA
jgi:ABC-type sugar transport system substrate-binding protein